MLHNTRNSPAPVNSNEWQNPQRQRPRWVGYVVTVLLEAALTAGLVLLTPIFPISRYPIPYVLLTMTIAYLFAEGPAIVSIVLGWALFTFFFVSPPGISWPPAHSVGGWAQQVALLLGMIVVDAAMIQAKRANQRIQRLADESIKLNASLTDEIGERRRTENALRESEERLRATFDNAGVGIVEVNADDVFTNVNTRALDVLGYTREELLGMTVHELTAPEDRDRSDEMNERLRRGEFDRFDYEKRYLHRDGSPVWAHMTISAIRDSQGNHLGAITTIEDISERKKAEEALAEREREYRALAENSPEVIARFDRQFRHTYVNEYGARVYGLPKEQVIGKTNADIGMPADKVAFWERHFMEVLESGKQQTVDFEFDSPSMGHQCFSSIFVPEINEDGEVASVLAITRDVTELRKAENALREGEERFRTLADNITQLAWMTDETGWIFWYNKRWFDYTGTTLEEMQGWGWQKVHHPDHVQRVTEKFRHSVAVGEPWEDTFPLRGKDGNYRWFLSRAIPIRDEQGKVVRWFGTNTDVTELLQAEENIRQLNAELEQRVVERTADLEAANRELEAFSYSVSHDLRAPLRAIDGFSNTLLKYYHDVLDARGQDYLQRVRNAAQRMGQLIDDILGLSRATRAEMHKQQVDLSAMALEILGELQNSQPGRQAEIEVEQGLVVNADPHLLRIALDNLLGNAWKFTGNCAVAHIQVGSLEQNGERVYYIKDNGAGFNPAYTERLFSPFQRLHSESEFSGTGIGLALVQRILRRHGGRIWAESQVDRGAVFYFTLEEADK